MALHSGGSRTNQDIFEIEIPMIDTLPMHPADRSRDGLQRSFNADALAKPTLQAVPKISSFFQLSGHQPATINRSADFFDASGKNLHCRNTSAAQLFGNT